MPVVEPVNYRFCYLLDFLNTLNGRLRASMLGLRFISYLRLSWRKIVPGGWPLISLLRISFPFFNQEPFELGLRIHQHLWLLLVFDRSSLIWGGPDNIAWQTGLPHFAVILVPECRLETAVEAARRHETPGGRGGALLLSSKRRPVASRWREPSSCLHLLRWCH